MVILYSQHVSNAHMKHANYIQLALQNAPWNFPMHIQRTIPKGPKSIKNFKNSVAMKKKRQRDTIESLYWSRQFPFISPIPFSVLCDDEVLVRSKAE